MKCLMCPHYVPEICHPSMPLCDSAAAVAARAAQTDLELIERHLLERQHGLPPVSFGTLFERYQRHVVAWACRISGNNYDLGRDLAQDVWIKAFRRIDAFRASSRFTTWLYTVTRNCFRDYVKARAARPREVDEAAIEAAPPVVANAGVAAIEARGTRALVGRLVHEARLDDLEKRVLSMHYRDEMPLDAITSELGLTNASGAKAQVVSAKRKLRSAATRWTRRVQAQLTVPAA
jgi:RNA polymerase sigma-70 factor (ECF subfamily)